MELVQSLLIRPAALADLHALLEELLEMQHVFEDEAVVRRRPSHRCDLGQEQKMIDDHHYSALFDVEVDLPRALLLSLHQFLHEQDCLMLR